MVLILGWNTRVTDASIFSLVEPLKKSTAILTDKPKVVREKAFTKKTEVEILPYVACGLFTLEKEKFFDANSEKTLISGAISGSSRSGVSIPAETEWEIPNERASSMKSTKELE